MSTDDEILAVSNIENAKVSDGTSTAGEHSTDTVIPEQSQEKPIVQEEYPPEDDLKSEKNIKNHVEIEENGSEDHENEQAEVDVATDKKTKVIDSISDQDNETNSGLPDEELTVV